MRLEWIVTLLADSGPLINPTLVAESAPWSGRLAFAAVFAALIAWLLFAPTSWLLIERRSAPWWRNVRFWAVCIALTQMLLYVLWR